MIGVRGPVVPALIVKRPHPGSVDVGVCLAFGLYFHEKIAETADSFLVTGVAGGVECLVSAKNAKLQV